MKKVFSVLVLFSLVLTLAVSASAAGTVSYAGTAQKFIFAPGSRYSPTDLFANLKDVMPGDSVTQQIIIRNEVSNGVKIKLYMRSLGAQEGSEAFLSQLTLCVQQEWDTVLFDAPADQIAQLTDWVYLGTFYSGAEIGLNVTLDVPVTLGNDYQDAVGYLDWQFKVEELPVEPSDPQPPKTGDTVSVLFWAVLMAASLMILVLLRRLVRYSR